MFDLFMKIFDEKNLDKLESEWFGYIAGIILMFLLIVSIVTFDGTYIMIMFGLVLGAVLCFMIRAYIAYRMEKEEARRARRERYYGRL